MGYNALDEQDSQSNVGQRYSPKEDLGRTIKLIWTPLDYQFATMADALDETKYQDASEQLADRCFVLPYFVSNEDGTEEAVTQDFPGGDSVEVRPGKYASKDMMHLSVADMAKMSTFNNKTGRIIKIDANGNILGTSPDGIVFRGFELSELNVQKMNQSDGSNKRMVPIYYKEREPSEWTDKPVALQPLKKSTLAWDPRNLDGLTDIEITEGVSTTSKIIVTLTAYLKGVLLSGFDTEGDILLKSSGVVQTITITDNNDGTYDLDGTGFANGDTIEMGASADLSQDGYEGIASITIANIA